MLNYEIKPSLLFPYLPAGTELDFWNNTCYISLVGFMFLDTRIKGISFPYHKNFEEVNLRFYVRYKKNDHWNRGVVFIREIVPKRMVRFVANTFYGERYMYLPMKNSLRENDDSLEIKYDWLLKKQWNFMKVAFEKASTPAVENSEEEFITEHYFGYTKLTDVTTSEYEVVHTKWQIHKVLSYDLFCDAENMYGKKFKEYFSKPKSVFMADGSIVEVKNKKIFKFPL